MCGYNDKKLLESSSSVFNFTKHQSYNKIPSGSYQTIFTKNNYILLTKETIDSELLGLGASNKYRAYREGELSYTVSMDGNVKDTISIALMGKLDTSYNPSGGSDVKVYLRTYYNQTLCDSVVKQFTGSFKNAYEFMFTGLSAIKKFNKVKLQIILGGNISFYFSDILLLPKKAGSFLKYDTSYNLLGQTFGASTIGTIYNSKGQLKTYTDASNYENEITYDEARNIIEVEQNGKSKKTYAFSGVTTGFVDKIKIPGITSGRGSLSSIQKQINTKLLRNRISGISAKTFGKMLALEFCNSLPSNFLNSFTNGIVLTPITDSY